MEFWESESAAANVKEVETSVNKFTIFLFMSLLPLFTEDFDVLLKVLRGPSEIPLHFTEDEDLVK